MMTFNIEKDAIKSYSHVKNHQKSKNKINPFPVVSNLQSQNYCEHFQHPTTFKEELQRSLKDQNFT